MALVLGSNCGFVTTAPDADPLDNAYPLDDRAKVFQTTSVTDGTISEVGMWINTISSPDPNVIQLGIYDDNSGEPNNLMESHTVSVNSGLDGPSWVKSSEFSTSVSSGTNYWIGAATSGLISVDFAITYTGRWNDSTDGLFDPWDTVGDSDSTSLFSVYALYSAGPSTNSNLTLIAGGGKV